MRTPFFFASRSVALGFALATTIAVACSSSDSSTPFGASQSATSGSATSGATTGAGGGTSATASQTVATTGPGPGSGGGMGVGGAAAGAGGGMAMGACTNGGDQKILKEKNVEQIVGQCAKDNLGAQPGTKNCIKMKTGLSDGCTTCFSDVVDCTVQKCLAQCLNGDSPACKMCREQNCLPAFKTCSGLSS